MSGVNLVGFDSAWSDRTPGAICSARLEAGTVVRFDPPRMVRFAEAQARVAALHGADDLTLVAIDQPTIVANASGARPVDRCVASVISWSGGGMQPAFRADVGMKAGMFGRDAPIWRFLDGLGYGLDPFAVHRAARGGVVAEVYPALALLCLEPAFRAGPRRGPRYNPTRRTFNLAAWGAVCRTAARESAALGLAEAALWCAAVDETTKPRKATQDLLDSVLCLIAAAFWLLRPERCLAIGHPDTGLIVSPMDAEIHARLEARAPAGVALWRGDQLPNVSSNA